LGNVGRDLLGILGRVVDDSNVGVGLGEGLGDGFTDTCYERGTLSKYESLTPVTASDDNGRVLRVSRDG
jgi:hypothetical protein